MRWVSRIAVLLLALIPLATLVHRDDLGGWDRQRSVMAGPDEFSYLLMARNFLEGGGLSVQAAVGRDTFYPPGYPLMLAGWAKLTNGGELTAFSAHALNATLLSISTIVVYLLAGRLLKMLMPSISRNACTWMAVLVAGLFATNWHVLECSLLIMSEPAFMLVVFIWIAMALAWPDWHLSPVKTFVMALLAVAAWSIRGAGIVCVAAMLLYPIVDFIRQWIADQRIPAMTHRISPIILIVLLASVYQLTLIHFSPEKSLAAQDQSDNSYMRQLQFGLTDGGRIHLSNPGDWPVFLTTLRNQIFSHLDDYASSFVPWPREDPDMVPRVLIGKIVGLLGLLGWAYHTFIVRWVASVRFLELFVLLYMGLYLLWPFNFARFWSPIMPIMLIYAVDAVIGFGVARHLIRSRVLATALLALLLLLAAEEDFLQLNNYARRLNYVSDCLSATVRAIIHDSPNPDETTIAVRGDDHFVLAWYLPRGSGYVPRSPEPHWDTAEQMLLRSMSELQTDPNKRLFLFSYFGHAEVEGIIGNLRRTSPDIMARYDVHKVYQKEIITAVWEITLRDKIPSTSAAADSLR